MRKFPVFPVALIFIALICAAFWLLPRADGSFIPGPVIEVPQSAMPVPEDAPDDAEDVDSPLMGDVEEALSAAPSPEASLIPAAPTPSRADQDKLGGDRWTLSWLGDESVPEGERAPNIMFDMNEARVSGYGGCNRYSGQFDLDDSTLSFGPIVATQMACDQLSLEMAYIGRLEKAVGWHIDKGVLVLKDDAGADVARFKRP